jgi:NAD(P)H-hydrate epimerase
VTAAPEVMSLALPELDGQLSRGGVERVTEAASRGGALALGPGIGRGHEAQRFALSLAAAVEVPLVLDADGLNAHAGRLGDLLSRKAPTVLTPHAGELARLLESDSESIERERLASVRRAAENSGAIVVLKGDDTLVCRPDGRVAVNPGGSPALASAGTGDVLTGVLAALLAQGLDAFTAACAAVFMHARAGRIAARRIGAAEGVLAGDVIESLPSSRQADWMEGEGGRG